MATPKRSARRSAATRRCISPWPQTTTSCASGLWTIVTEGSSSSSLCNAWPSLTSSLRSLAETAIESTGARRRDRQQRRMRGLAGGDGVAGHGMVELGERDGFAGAGGAALLRGLAQQLEDAGDAAGLALGRQEGQAVRDLAVEHARDRHLAAVRRVQRLEHIGERIVAGLDAEPLDGGRDVGRLVAQRLHQPQHAVGAGRGAHQHRADQAVAQLLRRDRRRPCPSAARCRRATAPSVRRRGRRASPASRSARSSRGRRCRLRAARLRKRCAPCRQRRARARGRRSR